MQEKLEKAYFVVGSMKKDSFDLKTCHRHVKSASLHQIKKATSVPING